MLHYLNNFIPLISLYTLLVFHGKECWCGEFCYQPAILISYNLLFLSGVYSAEALDQGTAWPSSLCVSRHVAWPCDQRFTFLCYIFALFFCLICCVTLPILHSDLFPSYCFNSAMNSCLSPWHSFDFPQCLFCFLFLVQILFCDFVLNLFSWIFNRSLKTPISPHTH